VKQLRLTGKGARLEKQVTGRQRQVLAGAFGSCGPDHERKWRQVTAAIAGELPEGPLGGF
jgi:hypothetical protein